ncbi:MAG: helix-turn-helix domain-containing protein [Chloroflexota bacterium]|nr:helix-turn-helix domain-containing protein [Chloroflexota bacterium]
MAARALAPALPALRGGEIILLSESVFTEQRLTLRTLLTDLARQRVAAVVVHEGSERLTALGGTAPMPVLDWRNDAISVETESELNRLLTERRNELYRFGTELGRLLSSATASGAGLDQVLELAFQEISVPIAVTDRTGIVLASSRDANDVAQESEVHRQIATRPNLISYPLRAGGRVWLGPVGPDRQAWGRVAADRLAGAVESALMGATWLRPRGLDRAEALQRFIFGAVRKLPSEARIQAVTLGLDPNATFRVALSPSADRLQELQRGLAPFGQAHEVAGIESHAAVLIELKNDRAGGAPGAARRVARLGETKSRVGDGPWIAISGMAADSFELTEAARQAVYVAGLFKGGLIQGATASFDQTADIGGFRLLYRLWDSPLLATFAADVLGDLVANDRYGVLRETLLHFLESGGSRVETAERAAIHRNTLAYRLRRISELANFDPAVPADRLSLHLALLAIAMPPTPAFDRVHASGDQARP